MTAEHGPLPLLCRDLVVVPDADGVLIEGGTRRHALRGSGASLLVRLMPLLDGSSDAPAVCSALDLTQRQLWQAIRALDRCGLIEDPGGTPHAADEVLDFFSRTLRSSGGYRGCAELFDELATAGVAVVGETPFGAALADDLLGSGIGVVVTSETPDPAALDRIRRCDRRLVIGWDDPARPDLLAATVAWGRQAGVRVLRVAADDIAVEIGPQFWWPYSACLTCLCQGRHDQGWPTGRASAGAAGSLAAGLAATEVLTALARIDVPATPRQLTRIPLSTLVSERFLVIPCPDCPSCVTLTPGVQETVSVATAYEWQMEWLHSDLDSRRPEQPDDVERIDALQTVRTVPDYLPGIPLPPDEQTSPCWTAFGEAGSPTPLTGELLGSLLARTAGLRKGHEDAGALRRWAPTGGNLASVECYVVSDRRLVDLPGTVFRYDDLDHRLVAVRADPVPVAEALADTDLDAVEHDTVLLLVAGVRRLASKYQSFGSRLAHLDAGCAAAQLLAVATAHGLPTRLASTWGTGPARTLELLPGQEVVTAIVGLGRNGEA
jgi:SagB-type dehydrogenase family enzyme